MNFKLAPLALVLFIVLSTSLAYRQFNIKQSPQDIEFRTISGESITLNQLKGQYVLVTFWSTDCPSCIEEIPHLTELNNKYNSNKLKIIAVTMDYTPPNQVLEMVKAKNIHYAVALDPDSKIAMTFGDIRLTPTTFLLNPKGEIESHIIGLFDLTEMEKRLNG
ncbi:MAG: TlpA disulfide reductase family protein [Methylomonas sp.]